MNLDKHPILWQGYYVVQAIETCGVSTELTNAVIKAGEYNEAVERLVDENTDMKAQVENMKCCGNCSYNLLRKKCKHCLRDNRIAEEISSVTKFDLWEG